MKRNKQMKKDKKKKGFYARKRQFLITENRRRRELDLEPVMGMDFPIGQKPWK